MQRLRLPNTHVVFCIQNTHTHTHATHPTHPTNTQIVRCTWEALFFGGLNTLKRHTGCVLHPDAMVISICNLHIYKRHTVNKSWAEISYSYSPLSIWKEPHRPTLNREGYLCAPLSYYINIQKSNSDFKIIFITLSKTFTVETNFRFLQQSNLKKLMLNGHDASGTEYQSAAACF